MTKTYLHYFLTSCGQLNEGCIRMSKLLINRKKSELETGYFKLNFGNNICNFRYNHKIVSMKNVSVWYLAGNSFCCEDISRASQKTLNQNYLVAVKRIIWWNSKRLQLNGSFFVPYMYYTLLSCGGISRVFRHQQEHSTVAAMASVTVLWRM